MLNDVEKEIFLKYKNALVTIGVDFEDYSVVDLIESCSHNLESKFQAIISYWYWLQNQNREIGNANQLLIEAFTHNWTPIEWQDSFLENPNFKSPAQKWWSMASRVDILKNLVVDVQDNFWSGGKIIFVDPVGDTWSMDLEQASDLTWEQLLAYYQRVTKTVIESSPSGYTIYKQ
ncbi:hypothetical protein NIES4102_42120 (plasmid) [Chondrocystis sp. NIES-4102]|nr:hypothetical protein NIES4102_41150 [Chondrocystis sp. NIES-4102]BAZ47166.1 hypothetical protein NIES4102_42120 [Chondrocystis sp. NIES-4102]